MMDSIKLTKELIKKIKHYANNGKLINEVCNCLGIYEPLFQDWYDKGFEDYENGKENIYVEFMKTIASFEDIRTISEVVKAIKRFEDIVWWNRSKSTSRKELDKKTREKIIKAEARIEKEINKSELILDDFDFGMVNGKLSALRWFLGDEWDNLDT